MIRTMLHKLLRRAHEEWPTQPWPRFRRYARRHLSPCGLKLERLGSDYGGWYVPVDKLTRHSICYLAGVGEDISFDLALIEACGCHIHAFDPTPRAAEHVARVAGDETRFHFHPIGLWSEEATKRFYAPRDPLHVSHSIVNLRNTEEFFEAHCQSMATIMRDLGHDHIDLLKIDIEGAEHQVLDSMLKAGIHPGILAVEFDQPAPYSLMRSTFDRVLEAGYALVSSDGFNLTFVQRDELH